MPTGLFPEDLAAAREYFGGILRRVVHRMAPHARVENLPDTGGWEVQTAEGAVICQVYLQQTDWTSTPEVYVPTWKDGYLDWYRPVEFFRYYHHIHEPSEEVWAVIGSLVQRAGT